MQHFIAPSSLHHLPTDSPANAREWSITEASIQLFPAGIRPENSKGRFSIKWPFLAGSDFPAGDQSHVREFTAPATGRVPFQAVSTGRMPGWVEVMVERNRLSVEDFFLAA
jgi:hypothetical protein